MVLKLSSPLTLAVHDRRKLSFDDASATTLGVSLEHFLLLTRIHIKYFSIIWTLPLDNITFTPFKFVTMYSNKIIKDGWFVSYKFTIRLNLALIVSIIAPRMATANSTSAGLF